MKLQNKIMLVVAAILCSCGQGKGKYHTETKSFSAYLKTNFRSEIGKDSAYYFLISETGCAGCVFNIINAFDSNRKSIFILPLSAHNKGCNQALPSSKILIDSNNKINRLPYHKGNIALLMTSDNRIDTIISFETITLAEQIEGIKKMK